MRRKRDVPDGVKSERYVFGLIKIKKVEKRNRIHNRRLPYESGFDSCGFVAFVKRNDKII